ncbi:rotatin-like isoform X1 [Octopus vulgaris]|uniref:Rotatin-like isoform X1 n=1 Tax=Octopus vulgaris TaxID=6645 RepID=A0AA36FEK1_OCTVU|nr:rotatin-like isoform X1 [Octopus vulgaris]
MPVLLRDDVDFERIFQKLGHELEEIRVRALKNVISKLNYGLVCLSDLVQEKHLFIRLLEWFNFPSAPMQSEVLGLLHQLSEHSTACESLREIGAIDFLSHLRMDSPTSLKDKIDTILENLMKIPDLDPKSNGCEHIHYQQACFDPVSTADPCDPQTAENDNIERVVYEDSVGSNPTRAKPGLGFTMRTFPWLTLTQTDRHVLSSTHSLFQNKDPHELANTCEFLRDVVFYDFPAEIFLQRPQITQSLLEVLELSCKQITPPLDYNTFLNQPNLLVQVSRTLRSLTSCLHTRLKYHQDPAFYTPKPDVWSNISTLSAPSPNGSAFSHSIHSNDTRFSALGKSDSRCTGDGRDGDTSMSSVERLSSQMILDASLQATDELEVENVQTLQQEQITLPVYCLDLIFTSLSLLKKSSQLSDVSALVQLLPNTVELLSESITVEIWSNQSEAARKIVNKLKDCIELICELLQQHHHRNQLFENRKTSQELIVKSRQIFIALSCFLVSFLEQLVTVEKIQSSMPEILPTAIELVAFDECVSQMWPDLHAAILGYLYQLAHEKYCLYTHTARVCTSLQRTCCFLAKVSQVDDDSTELLDLASSCLLGIPYHIHVQFIHRLIDFCSQYCRTLDVCRLKEETQVFEIFVKLLAHSKTRVKEISYEYTLKLVKEYLNINEIAAHTSSSLQLGIKFLINPIVLHEIIFFGMADTDKKISQLAADILLYLLQAQLLVDGDIWQEFIAALAKSLPLLQSYAETETPLGYCIFGMVEPNKESGPTSLPRCEKFRGVLRLMFSPNSKVRCEAVTHLLWFICHEKEQELKLPQVNDLKIPELPDFFSMPCLQLLELELEQETSVFNADDVTKVYNIFCSKTLDEEMKKSALEQLAIMLLDHNLHNIFKELGGIEEILFYIHKSVLKEQASSEQRLINYTIFLPCCVNILSVILQYNSTERHRLKDKEELYYSLLRVALLHDQEESLKYEVTKILTFLLFDEVILSDAACKSPDDKTKFIKFSMPYFVCKRYNFPYKPPIHPQSTSIYSSEYSTLDPLTPSLKEMIRFAWNFAWHHGINGLVQFGQTSSTSSETVVEYPKHLELSSTDFLIIKTSHLPTGLQEAVQAISTATNHFAVNSALNVLHLYMVMPGNCQNISCKTLHQLKWNEALSRFLQVVPSSPPDQWLLCEVLYFIGSVFKLSGTVPLHILQWLANIVYNPKAALYNLLHRTEGIHDVTESMAALKKSLEKEVINVITCFLSHQPYVLHSKLKIEQLRGDLTEMLLIHLNVAEAPHFYNLAPLQASLQCLMHVTARLGWSGEISETDGVSLTLKLLGCLLEIISAFHIGRGGTVMSYMGKGVTKSATMCLQHLALEMEIYSENEKWPEHWLYMKEQNRLLMETGLNWLLTLWAYRDPEVRCAGLGIAVTLSWSSVGRSLVTANCRHIPGGIWGVVFTILLDSSESSLVRQQAAYLLVNLISKPLPSSSNGSNGTSEGPVINDSYYQEPLVGLTALMVLLQHCQFYQTVSQLLAMYYPQPTISPLTFMETNYSLLPGPLLDVPVTGAQNKLKMMQIQQLNPEHSSVIPNDVTSETIPSCGGSKVDQTGYYQQTPLSISNQSSVTNSKQSTPRSPRGVDKFPAFPARTNVNTATTPALVTAVCHLLHNLVILSPEDTVSSLTNHLIPASLMALLDSELLEENVCCESGSDVSSGAVELLGQQLLQMHCGIIKLMETCSVQNATFRKNILHNTSFLSELVHLLGVSPQQESQPIHVMCETMYQKTFSMLSTFLQLEGSLALDASAVIFEENWSILFGCIEYTLLKKQNQSLQESCLMFLAHLFAEEGKMHSKTLKKEAIDNRIIKRLLDDTVPPSSKRYDANQNTTSGSILCNLLMKMHERVISKPGDELVHLSGNALKCLLAISFSAKDTALKGGFVESVMQHLKDWHAKLNLAFLQSKKNSSSRKKQTESLLQDVLMAFQILTNFATHHQEVKLVCQSSYLPQMVHSMWCWCLEDKPLMCSAVNLLISYTANCPKACSSLAYTHPVTQGSSSSIIPNRNQLSNNSLVHCLVHLLASEPTKDNGSLITSVFHLLSILMVSGECRNILLKVNFLNEFLNITVKRTKRKTDLRNSYDAELCWLELFRSLSFSDEGQLMIFKIKNSIERLLDLCENGTTISHQEKALLVIRNISCHCSNKNKLLAYNQLIPVLLKCLASEEEILKVIAATTLSALVYNNQKAKVILKNANMLPNLQDSLQGLSEFSELGLKCKEHVQNIIESIIE